MRYSPPAADGRGTEVSCDEQDVRYEEPRQVTIFTADNTQLAEGNEATKFIEETTWKLCLTSETPRSQQLTKIKLVFAVERHYS